MLLGLSSSAAAAAVASDNLETPFDFNVLFIGCGCPMMKVLAVVLEAADINI